MKTTFNFHKTSLEGLFFIEPLFVPDERGYFLKSYESNIFREHNIDFKTVECYESMSAIGVIRGLHFQKEHWQTKLVRCLKGRLFDVAVDIRRDSPTFGRWEGFYLSPQNRSMLYIPVGFAHGFLSMEEDSLISYIFGDRYDPASDGGIRWDDPDIDIKWPIEELDCNIIVSTKDGKLPFLKDCLR